MRLSTNPLKERIEVKLYAVVGVGAYGKPRINHIFKTEKAAYEYNLSNSERIVELTGAIEPPCVPNFTY